MRTILIVIACTLLCAYAKVNAQLPPGRIFGAGSFEVDDGTRSGKTLRWDVTAPLSQSYQLHFPNTPPVNGLNYISVDQSGNIAWSATVVPALAQGNIWVGNSQGVAQSVPPGPIGTILGIDPASGMPEWMNYVPSNLSVSASQITSGTLQPGVTIIAGDGSNIYPSGTGQITANGLTGSGINKYSGSIPISQNAITMFISYPGLTASSTVLVSIADPSGQTAQVSVEQKMPGAGFNVTFSGYYPTTTGSLNYIVIN